MLFDSGELFSYTSNVSNGGPENHLGDWWLHRRIPMDLELLRFEASAIINYFFVDSSILQTSLEMLRSEYWTTRVEGNGTMWLALRTAAEALQHGDLPLANAVIEVGFDC